MSHWLSQTDSHGQGPFNVAYSKCDSESFNVCLTATAKAKLGKNE